MKNHLSASLESTLHARNTSIKINIFISNSYFRKECMTISSHTDI